MRDQLEARAMTNLSRAVGQVIYSERMKHNLTQLELGQYAGLYRSYIGELECGRRNISLGTLGKLAEALQMKAWELLRMAEEGKR